MRNKKYIIILVALIILSISAGSAMAYSLVGCKWSSKSIKFSDYTTGSYAWSASRNWDNPTGLTNNITISTPNLSFTVMEVSQSGVGWDGICYLTSSAGWISSAHCKDNLYYTSSYNSSTHQGVVTHEFGHGLGLGDLAGPVIAVMQGYTSMRAYTTVQVDDNNGINALYP
jgi:hypothetical protein